MTENNTVTEESAGSVKVHESVFISIAKRAIEGVPGVLRLAGGSFVDNIAEIVGSKKIFDRSIVVEVGENTVSIEVRIVAQYGNSLSEIACNVQKAVVDAIAETTGMTVSKIEVLIMDLDDAPEENSTSADAEVQL